MRTAPWLPIFSAVLLIVLIGIPTVQAQFGFGLFGAASPPMALEPCRGQVAATLCVSREQGGGEGGLLTENIPLFTLIQ